MGSDCVAANACMAFSSLNQNTIGIIADVERLLAWCSAIFFFYNSVAKRRHLKSSQLIKSLMAAQPEPHSQWKQGGLREALVLTDTHREGGSALCHAPPSLIITWNTGPGGQISAQAYCWGPHLFSLQRYSKLIFENIRLKMMRPQRRCH